MCKAIRDMIDEGKEQGITIGKEQGIAIGEKKGTIAALFGLVKDNIIPLADAAQRASTTEEHFMELVEQYSLNN